MDKQKCKKIAEIIYENVKNVLIEMKDEAVTAIHLAIKSFISTNENINEDKEETKMKITFNAKDIQMILVEKEGTPQWFSDIEQKVNLNGTTTKDRAFVVVHNTNLGFITRDEDKKLSMKKSELWMMAPLFYIIKECYLMDGDYKELLVNYPSSIETIVDRIIEGINKLECPEQYDVADICNKVVNNPGPLSPGLINVVNEFLNDILDFDEDKTIEDCLLSSSSPLVGDYHYVNIDEFGRYILGLEDSEDETYVVIDEESEDNEKSEEDEDVIILGVDSKESKDDIPSSNDSKIKVPIWFFELVEKIYNSIKPEDK